MIFRNDMPNLVIDYHRIAVGCFLFYFDVKLEYHREQTGHIIEGGNGLGFAFLIAKVMH